MNNQNHEETRGAKEKLKSVMTKRKYKETRDQTKFVNALNFEKLKTSSRSFLHLYNTLEWLVDEKRKNAIYHIT